MGRRARFLTFVMAVALIAGIRASQKDSIEQTIRLQFPDGTDLTGLWVNYFLRGPFGGYGGNGRLDPGTREYIISTSREGRLATTFEAIVYVPGYRFVVLPRTPLDGRRAEIRRIELQPLTSLPLSGEIILARPVKGVSIEAGYMASWECDLFMLFDCLQTWIPVARTVVAEDGRFTLNVPDFVQDPVVAAYTGRLRGNFRLFARETTSGNIAYHVEDLSARGRAAELPVASQYPQDLQLVVVPRP
jgi:hypothetical protein